MNYWSRDNTKDWIHQIENRVEDFQYYVDRTLNWCEQNDVYSEKTILILTFMTCIWVSTMREEPITFSELMEILNLPLDEKFEDKIYELDDRYKHLDHDQLLEFLLLNDSDD